VAVSSSGNPHYNMKIVKAFAICAVVYLVVGALVGDIIAWQLSFPALNLDEHLSFGRLRPLHTNAVIFAFWRLYTHGDRLLCRSAYLCSSLVE